MIDMSPGKFLRLIWPSTGFYCIAHPFKPEGSSVTVYRHKVFATISEAVTHVHEMQHSQDTYFAVLSLKEPRVWDADKTDYKTGLKGAWATRLQTNMLASKCSFFDLDVGTDATKYPTQRDAMLALIKFLEDTGLPMPMLVSSGGGVHVYWPYDTEIPALEWRDLAWSMRQLADAAGLKVDPTRTIDTSSVLRVPKTFNWKDRQNPRPVEVLQEGAVTPVGLFKQLVADALIRHGVVAGSAPVRAAPPADNPLGEMVFHDFGPPPTLKEVAAACAQVQEIIKSQGEPTHPHYGQLDNTAWYRGMIATVSHVEDGDDWCRKLTALHPRTNANIEAKLLQTKQFPPARCETLQQFMPWKDTPCQTCRFRLDPSVPNPIAAARKATVAPPPVIRLLLPGVALQAVAVPNPPKPYERLKTGGIAVTRKDKDDNESTSVIYPHDLYPVKRLTNSDAGTEQQVWMTMIPRSGPREFTIDADVLYDARKFSTAIANNGIYPEKANIPALQDYMVAYISQLQRSADADNQVSHLGWADGYRQFVLPEKTLLNDGTVKASALTTGAKTAAQFITRRGDLGEQVKLMGFYNHRDYLAHQYAILNFLASVIFYATGNHGIVVNMSGESGASKSTALYAGAGLWGDPFLWPINGTNRGATANARMQRIATNANLPTAVDEITHIPPKEAIDLVMSITQPGHRLRLGTDGAEKAGGDSYKSSIMVATANSSLHALLSTDNAAGTAGSMRVFEMKIPVPRVHTKAQADEFKRQLGQHFGHLGEVFIQTIMPNLTAVEHRVQQLMREIDTEAHIQAAERFWSADAAAVLTAGELARALGILPYDPLELRGWVVGQQIPYMRGVVKEEYRDPLAVLTDYIAERHGNILVIAKATAIGVNTGGQSVAGEASYADNSVHGALLGHYDVKAGVLYLLKQAFKDHCNRVGASSSRILDELSTPRVLPGQPPRRIVTERAIRRTLGAGTSHAKGQTWCFAIDMTHPEMAGARPVPVAGGGAASSPPAGQLSVVK